MPISGRKPKPDGQKRNRHQPAFDWTVVPDVPFRGGPRLPARQPGGAAWPPRTRAWWAALSRMPHCVLWTPADWSYALDTAFVHAAFSVGDMKTAGELRNREKVLGTTIDARRDLRIRYVGPAPETATRAEVTSMGAYRDALR